VDAEDLVGRLLGNRFSSVVRVTSAAENEIVTMKNASTSSTRHPASQHPTVASTPPTSMPKFAFFMVYMLSNELVESEEQETDSATAVAGLLDAGIDVLCLP
jgi:hypothetical protein